MTKTRRVYVRALSLAVSSLILTVGAMPQSSSKPDAMAAARFLEQPSWGPTSDSVGHVEKVGFETYIEEQFQAPRSAITVPAPDAKGKTHLRPLQDQFFYNAIHGEDQLRQRVMFALDQIWVVSGVKIKVPAAMVNYLMVLEKDAFANYYNVMRDVTLSPAMGHYPDMVDSDKPDPVSGKGANENYAREILQLFTIGLSKMNPDGTLIKDDAGNPLPTYGQDTIESFARAFTGWTCAPAPGAKPRIHNPPNWTDPMVPSYPSKINHDIYPKELLDGETLPANQTEEQDLEGALRNIFEHHNVGPFVCRQLTQHLVTSNPSNDYLCYVSGVFNGEGNTPRGDLKAVVKAVLLHPGARNGDYGVPPAGEGHLREPVLFINGLLRALGGTVDPANGLPPRGAALGQNVYFPPTVFSHFAPPMTFQAQPSTCRNSRFSALRPHCCGRILSAA